MPTRVNILLDYYVKQLKHVYGEHLKAVILYGSYARGDFQENSDIDIMILLDIDDIGIKEYRHKLSGVTYDFNMDNNVDVKPIAKSKEHFEKWKSVYPFYKNVDNEGVIIYGVA